MTDRYPDIEFLKSAYSSTKMIGQQEAWDEALKAVKTGSDDRSFHLVLVKGRGGMGKTRLLEELRDHVRPPSGDPNHLDALLTDPIISNIVDVIDIRLHDRYQFVLALRESLAPYGGKLPFRKFKIAKETVDRLRAQGALQDRMNEAQRNAVRAFEDDLREISRERRVVFLVDTVERLAYEAWQQLIDDGLLLSTDLATRTHQWLYNFIAWSDEEERKPGAIDNPVVNVTLVLAGRGPNPLLGPSADPLAADQEAEGQSFFDRMRQAEQKARPEFQRRLNDITLKRLSINEVARFFEQLAKDRAHGPAAFAESLRLVADKNSDRHKVLAVYTGGLPIRLALYTLVILWGKQIPRLLLESFADACRRTGLGEPGSIKLDQELPERVTREQTQAQWKIEGEFINLIFNRVDADEPEPAEARMSEVLLALVRSPRGLTAEQLHFLLDSPPNQKPADWQPDRDKLDEFVKLLEGIEQLDLGRSRGSWTVMGRWQEGSSKAATFRVGLQDEIYRIYAAHMGGFGAIEGEDPAHYEANRSEEVKARRNQYRKLSAFANFQYDRYLAAKQGYLRQDEERFENDFILHNAQSYVFPALSPTETARRLALHDTLSILEIERMVYRLLLDPQTNVNTDYIRLEENNDRAARQEEDFWAQAEMWRVLHDDSLIAFVDYPQRQQLKPIKESQSTIMRRFAEQENVSRWIKRFVLRGEYERAVEFGERAEAWSLSKPRTNDSERVAWDSWNHTLAREERAIWTNRARARLGTGTQEAIDRIWESIRQLQRLYDTDVLTQVPELCHDDHVEWGFKGVPKEHADHPAHTRLRQLIAHAYNILGFSYRMRGDIELATKYYGAALHLIRLRRRKDPSAHHAVVLNNLARALSDLGWNALSICLDALEMRWQVAEEVPLAGSYNTLAILYDDMGRYEDAPILAAKAIAYCRRASEPRQLGLALRQMAESLRHLAERMDTKQRVATRPDDLFAVADQLLGEANAIFESMNELERLVEVNVEWGSLHRDQMRPVNRIASPDWQDSYREAQRNLVEALELAGGRFAQHVMDAHINLAQIHYYADLAKQPEGGDPKALERAEAALVEVETQAGDDYLIKEHRPLPNRVQLRNRNWIFRHLSTAEKLRGWMALDHFSAFVKKHTDPTAGDTLERRQKQAEYVTKLPEAQGYLLAAAKAYAKGLAYAELYSLSSRSIGTIQSDLYGRLCQANPIELESFRKQLDQVSLVYPDLHTVELIHAFLNEFFGGPIEVQLQKVGNHD